MTLPPSDPTPGIPGASSWTPQGAPQRQPAPVAQPVPGFGGQPPYGAPPVFASPQPIGGVPAQFQLASWPRRVAAQILDHLFRLLLGALIAVVGFVLLADHPFSWDPDLLSTVNEASSDTTGLTANNGVWVIVTAISISYLSGLIYAPAFMAIWNGATPAKQLLGIRVIREDGRDLGFGMAFVREPIVKGLLVNAIGGSFFVPWVVNYLWPLWDRECRAGHDFLVHTRVVRAR